MGKRIYCDDCEELIDDWEAPDGGAWRVEGRTLCRWCYLDAVRDPEEGDEDEGTEGWQGDGK